MIVGLTILVVIRVIHFGNMNCDAVADLNDIPLFVQTLVDPGGFASCDINRADMNGDSLVDGRDCQAFADLMLSP